jgi:hypothetical protein
MRRISPSGSYEQALIIEQPNHVIQAAEHFAEITITATRRIALSVAFTSWPGPASSDPRGYQTWNLLYKANIPDSKTIIDLL